VPENPIYHPGDYYAGSGNGMMEAMPFSAGARDLPRKYIKRTLYLLFTLLIAHVSLPAIVIALTTFSKMLK
jgi:hypothetical protein